MKELPWAYVTIEDLSENGSQESLFPEREIEFLFWKAESEVWFRPLVVVESYAIRALRLVVLSLIIRR